MTDHLDAFPDPARSGVGAVLLGEPPGGATPDRLLTPWRRDPPPTGCVVAVRVEFEGPEPERQRRWVDTVFEALETEREPHPGGISGHFHVSVDGTRVLNYAEWTDAAAHRDALARSGQGAVGPSPAWRRVHAFPGVRGSEVGRYRLAGGLSRTVEDARA